MEGEGTHRQRLTSEDPGPNYLRDSSRANLMSRNYLLWTGNEGGAYEYRSPIRKLGFAKRCWSTELFIGLKINFERSIFEFFVYEFKRINGFLAWEMFLYYWMYRFFLKIEVKWYMVYIKLSRLLSDVQSMDMITYLIRYAFRIYFLRII